MTWDAKDNAVLQRRLATKPIGKVVVIMEFTGRQFAGAAVIASGKLAFAVSIRAGEGVTLHSL